MLKVTWAMSRVPKPRVSRSGRTTTLWTPLNQTEKSPQKVKKATKNRHMATPVTMSAFIMGMLLTVLSAVRVRRRRL